jgi:serine/threonine protein kinase
MSRRTGDWSGLTVSDGRYAIAAILGAGGMGIVYRARDRRLDTDVVIKVPRQAMLLDPEFAGRFAREIRSLVALSHPNIVKVTDVGQHEGLPFAVLQYLPGGSLEDRQTAGRDGKAGGALKEIPRWLRGVADALDYIHSKGYVHRDVKPGNILFDAQGHAFLGDFGVIKALAAVEPSHQKSATGAGLVLGTPEYMAPELIMGGDVDGRVDQYALAVTVYEVLCGRRPFEGPSPTAVLVLHTTRAPVSPSELRAAIASPISEAVLRGLAKDAAGRYPSCAAFAAAVGAAIEASPAEMEAPASGSSESSSVKVLCPGCGKRIAIAMATFASLKRSGRSFACPRCQAAIQVSSEKTQILSNPPTIEGSPTPAGTRKITATGVPITPVAATQKIEHAATQKIEHAAAQKGGPGGTQIVAPAATRKITPPATQKIAMGNTPSNEPTGGRASTLKIDSLDVVISPEVPSPGTALDGRARPWLVSAMAVAAVLMLILAGVFVFRPNGPTAAVVPIPSAIQEDRATTIARSSRPGTEPREPRALIPPLAQDARAEDRPAVPAAPTSPTADVGGRETPVPASTPLSSPFTAPTPSIAVASPPAGPTIEVASTTRPGIPTASTGFPADGNPPSTGDTSASGLDPSRPPANPGEAKPSGPGPGLAQDKKPAKVDLDTILSAPQDYADREISPSGLFLVGSSAVNQPNGGTTLAVVPSEMNVQRDGSLPPRIRGKTYEIEVEQVVLDRLIAKGIVRRGTLASSQWGRNLAMLTLRVIKGARYDAGGWVCRIIKAEFLLNVDYARISDRKYGRSFQTFTIGVDGERGGIGDGDEWSARLGQHALVSIGKVYKSFKNQQLQAITARNNAIMGSMIGEAVREAAAASAAEEAMRREAMTGGRKR